MRRIKSVGVKEEGDDGEKDGSDDPIINLSYFFLVSRLVKKLHDFLGQLVVGAGPDASSLVALDHDLFEFGCVCVQVFV